NHFLDPDMFNQLFTMHGTTMIFLVVMPILAGFTAYLVPLMIGASDVAFPRLNAFSFWVQLFGGIVLYFSFVAGGAPNAGWFSYAPLSDKAFSSGSGQDFWLLGLAAVGIGTLAGAINMVVTILTMRPPGMRLQRLPLFCWMTFVNSWLMIAALPIFNAVVVMLLADRALNAHFFTPSSAGSRIF